MSYIGASTGKIETGYKSLISRDHVKSNLLGNLPPELSGHLIEKKKTIEGILDRISRHGEINFMMAPTRNRDAILRYFKDQKHWFRPYHDLSTRQTEFMSNIYDFVKNAIEEEEKLTIYRKAA